MNLENNSPSIGLLNRVHFRLAEESDLPALEWEGEFVHFRNLFAQSYQRHREGLGVMWLADLPPGYLIGQVFLQLTSDRKELADGVKRAYLYSFRIRQPYRNQGLGTRLLSHIEEDLYSRGYRILTLNVARDNTDAQRMYMRNGYQIVAPEAGIWSYIDHLGVRQDVEEPAWRMEKLLTPRFQPGV